MNDKKQERWIYAVALVIPVVWLALLTAPCLGGSIVDNEAVGRGDKVSASYRLV